jgi:predicted ArsR family transcriptional regulator
MIQTNSIMPQNAPGVKGLGEQALTLASKGYPVFPLHPSTKEPATKHGLKDATTDPKQIRQWWSQNPDYNIGIAAPELLVIDVDDPELFGAGTKQKLFGDFVPAEIPAVATPRGGFHYYMRVNPDWATEWGVGNNVGALPGVDLKGCGRGYVVAPGSTINGKQYVLVGGWAELPPVDQLPELPERARRAIEQSASNKKPANRNGNGHNPQTLPIHTTVDLQELERCLLRIWTRGRRQALALAISGMLRKLGCDEPTTAALIARVAAAADDEEQEKRLDAVRDTYANALTSVAGWTLLTNEEQAALEPVLGRPKPDPANHSMPTQTPGTNTWRSRLHRISEIQAADYPEMEWLVDGVLPARGLIVLAGRPKSGKSWLALDLVLSVAAGTDCMGRPTGTTGVTIYLALEDSPARIKERSEIIGLSSDNAYIATSWWAADQGGYEELREMVRELRPKLVVVDTLAAFKAGSAVIRKPQFEIDYDQARKLKSIADENSCCVLLVHHTRKADADDVFDTISGTLGLNAVADTIAVLQHSRGSNAGKLHITGRDVADEQFAATFDNGRWIICHDTTQNEETTRDKVLRAVRQWGPAKARELRDIAAQEGIGYDALRQTLRRLVADGVLAQDELGQYYCSTTHTYNNSVTVSQCHNVTVSQCHSSVTCDTVTHTPKTPVSQASDWDRKHAARVLAALQPTPKSIRELSDELALEYWQIRRGLQLLLAQGQAAPQPDGRWQAVAAKTEGEPEAMNTEIGIPESAEPWIQQVARRTRDWMLEQLAQAPRDRKWLLRQAPADDEYPAVFVFDALILAGAVVVSRSGAARLSQAGHELWARIQASQTR